MAARADVAVIGAGESRIFRHAHDDPRMVAFACEARRACRNWEERFGREFVSRDGVVAIGPVAERRLAVLRGVGGVRARAIDASELAERLPLLARWDGPATIDEDGGVIHARAAIEALPDTLRDTLLFDEVHDDGSLLDPSGLATAAARTNAYVGRALDHFAGSPAPAVRLSSSPIRASCSGERDRAVAAIVGQLGELRDRLAATERAVRFGVTARPRARLGGECDLHWLRAR